MNITRVSNFFKCNGLRNIGEITKLLRAKPPFYIALSLDLTFYM